MSRLAFCGPCLLIFYPYFMKRAILTFSTIILLSVFCGSASAINPESALYVNRGDSCSRINDTYNSMLWYQKAYAIDSCNDTIVRKLAQCYYVRGQYKNCISLTDTLLADTAIYQDLRLRFNCFRKMAKDTLANECAKQIVVVNPLDATVVASMAAFYIAHEEVDSALLYAEAYYKIDSTNQQVNAQLATSLYLKKDYHRALDLFLEIYDNGDYNLATLYYIGILYDRCNIPDKAFYYLNMANMQSLTPSLSILKALSRVAIRTEHRDEALSFTDEALAICQADSVSMAEVYSIRADFYEAYSLKYEAGGDTVEAESCVKKQIKMLLTSLQYDNDIKVQYSLALAYYHIHDTEKTLHWLQSIIDSEWEATKANKKVINSAKEWMSVVKEEDFFRNGTEAKDIKE